MATRVAIFIDKCHRENGVNMKEIDFSQKAVSHVKHNYFKLAIFADDIKHAKTKSELIWLMPNHSVTDWAPRLATLRNVAERCRTWLQR